MRRRCEAELVSILIRKPRPIRTGVKLWIPLIHTTTLENSLQDVGGGSQGANCELKYDI